MLDLHDTDPLRISNKNAYLVTLQSASIDMSESTPSVQHFLIHFKVQIKGSDIIKIFECVST